MQYRYMDPTLICHYLVFKDQVFGVKYKIISYYFILFCQVKYALNTIIIMRPLQNAPFCLPLIAGSIFQRFHNLYFSLNRTSKDITTIILCQHLFYKFYKIIFYFLVIILWNRFFPALSNISISLTLLFVIKKSKDSTLLPFIYAPPCSISLLAAPPEFVRPTI